MSTTHTAVRQEDSAPIDDVDASITPDPRPLRNLLCPADGQILGMMHKCDGGHFECPRCVTRWEPQEVLD